MKLHNINTEGKTFLKDAGRKRMVIYKGMEIILTPDFSSAVLNTRTQQSNIFQVLRKIF